MATTAVDFVLVTKTGSYASGSGVKAAPFVKALERNAALNITGAVPGGGATGILGSSGLPNNGTAIHVGGFALQGFAKNGASHVTTSGTTPVTLDLTNLATNATSNDGDTGFSTVSKLKFRNAGAAAMTIAPAASNPASIGMGGTSPTLTINPGCEEELTFPTAITVDSTHKGITITPTSGGDFVLAVGGA